MLNLVSESICKFVFTQKDIPTYDSVPTATTPTWIAEPPRPLIEQVTFTSTAEDQLRALMPKLKFYEAYEEVINAIKGVLSQDPRSVYLREHWDEWKETG
jgi:hypothetical protein